MKSLSKRKSLCMIPELPGLEEHYASFSAMNLSPAASPRREPTLTRKREARKSIVKESLVNALTILEEVDESSSSMEFLDTSLKSIATGSTGPLTDDERDNNNSFSSSTDEAEYPPGASDIGKFCRWGLRCSRNDYTSTTPSSHDDRGIQEEPQQHNSQEEHGDEKYFLHSHVARRKHHDCPPVCPVRKRTIERNQQQATSGDE
mmetsp:Transcript_11326/g.28631  ORF Transcript_11326/g.28631 Transcript_11326/m.28631 type:complete len:204 (+) Transcript_11326:170-781(+)